MNSPNHIADSDLYKLLEELRQLKEERKVIEEREKAVKQSISCSIGDADAICDYDGNVLATYKYQERKTFDTESFKDSYPDMYKMYSKITEVRTLLLKE